MSVLKKNLFSYIPQAMKKNLSSQAIEQFNIGHVHHLQGRIAEAAIYYQRAIQYQPDFAEAFLALGVAQQSLKQMHKAERALRQAVKLKPQDAGCWFALGCALQELDKPLESQQCYENAIQRNSNYVQAYHNLGLIHHRRGELDKAHEYFQQAVNLDPENADLHNNLGLLYKDYQNWPDAVAHCRRAILLQPDFAQAYYNLALILQAQQRHAEAISVYRTAVLLAPGLSIGHLNLGYALQACGRYEEAVQAYEKALEQHPQFPEAHCALGHVQRLLGNLERATACYQRALDLRPDYPEAQHYFAVVGNLPAPSSADPEYVAQLFDDYATHYEQHLLESLEYQVPRQFEQLLLSVFAPDVTDLEILDLGCGTGLCAPFLRPYAKNLIGIDLSSKMIAQAQKRQLYDQLHVSEMTHWLQETNISVDLIFAADVFIYVGDLHPVLQRCAHVLKPGGHLIFSVEAVDSLSFVLQNSGRYAHNIEYLRSQAMSLQFQEVVMQSAVLRQDRGKPIHGWLSVWRR